MTSSDMKDIESSLAGARIEKAKAEQAEVAVSAWWHGRLVGGCCTWARCAGGSMASVRQLGITCVSPGNAAAAQVHYSVPDLSIHARM